MGRVARNKWFDLIWYLLVCVVFEPTHVISSFFPAVIGWMKPVRRHFITRLWKSGVNASLLCIDWRYTLCTQIEMLLLYIIAIFTGFVQSVNFYLVAVIRKRIGDCCHASSYGISIWLCAVVTLNGCSGNWEALHECILKCLSWRSVKYYIHRVSKNRTPYYVL